MKLVYELKHPNAVVPKKANVNDAGFDLTAVTARFDVSSGFFEYDTGVAVEIPPGYVGLVYPRSSISKYDLQLANSVGVIDSGYCDSIKLRFKVTAEGPRKIYIVGERIGQLVVIPLPEIELVQGVVGGDRGGFGTSGE